MIYLSVKTVIVKIKCVFLYREYGQKAPKEIKTKDNYTLIKCQIETGRKHQIRVHLNHLHHPIIGDTLYGKTSSMIKRMALHAYCLEFIHPLTYQTIKIECLLPFDMEKIFK